MIEELRIRNLGVIEEAEVAFGQSMCAITGETGAGKTMALTSLSLLMGGKAEPAKVRGGAEQASVEGTFVVSQDSPAVDVVTSAGGAVDVEDGQAVIIVSRTVPRTGRSRAFVGGQAVPLAVLHELSGHLVTVHGQSDQLRLKSASAQREALDRFGGDEIAGVRETYQRKWQEFNAKREELEAFRLRAKEAGTERLALEALVKRVDGVKPRAGEDIELKRLALQLDNVEALREAMAIASGALSGDEDGNGALALLDLADRELRKASSADPELAEFGHRLGEIARAASDVSNEIGLKLAALDADPERLNKIHARRAELNSLQKELGMSLEEIISRRSEADERLASIADPGAHIEKLEGELELASSELLRAGEELSEVRKRYGVQLSEQVTDELANLAMKDATFAVALERRNDPGAHGLDDVTFKLAPHRGSELLPLGSTASGGEMSRIMLALEVILSGESADSDHTFIFDEVDAGIGGTTALRVGERLAELGKKYQVIVVTHLAQVAASATEHIVVNKDASADGGVTDVRALKPAERERELARMLSGHAESEAARTHAAELLQFTDMPR